MSNLLDKSLVHYKKLITVLGLILVYKLSFSQSTEIVDSLGNLNEHFIVEHIYFDYDKGTIRHECYATLDTLAALILAEDSTKYEVQGHTDCRGSAMYSRKLSDLRARSVKQYLIDKGVAEDRLIAKGYEEDRPRVLEDGTELTCDYISRISQKNQVERYHQMNRRMEFLRLK